MNARGPLRLARYSALVWCALIVYASLHPFAGWRSTGISPLAFLEGGWPRYWTAFDLAANVAVYLPLGFFLSLGLSTLRWRYTAPLLASLFGMLLSGSLEALQTWLPSRVPSSLDLACNSLGSLLGALLAAYLGPRVLARLLAFEQKLLAPVAHAELGLTLLGLWLLLPLSPETLLFGAGDLRQFFALTPVLPFSVERFSLFETGIVTINAIAVGLILRSLLVHNLVWLIAWLCVRQRSVGLLLSLATLLVWLALAMLVAAAYLPIFKMSVVVS